MFHIYVIEHISSGKAYVGKTKAEAKRLRQHKWLLRKGEHNNKHLQRAWHLYGERDFDFYLIDSYETVEEVNQAEIFFISWFRELGLCYNHTGGGDGGLEPDEETRQKYRQRWIDKPHPMLGRKHSEETRKKLVESHLGYQPTDEARANHKAAMQGIKPSPQTIAAAAEAHRGKSYFKGRKHSEETKKKLSESRLGEQNPMFGKPTSDKQKEAASNRWKGVKRGEMSEETKQKLREAAQRQVRKPMSDETKELIRQKKLERDRLAREAL